MSAVLPSSPLASTSAPAATRAAIAAAWPPNAADLSAVARGGATGAALGRTWPRCLGGAGGVVTIGRVLIDSLFGEPLVLAGVLGLAAGLSLLGLVLPAELLN